MCMAYVLSEPFELLSAANNLRLLLRCPLIISNIANMIHPDTSVITIGTEYAIITS
jgi:hypothetical protein